MVFARLDEGPNGQGVYVRLFEFEQGAMGSINFESSNTFADIEEVLPPDDQNFLHAEMTLLIRANDVIACGMANKNRTFAAAVAALSADMSLTQNDFRWQIEDVPNKVTLNELRDSGVRSIDLGVTDYLASLPDTTSGMHRILKTILIQPSSNSDLRKRRNTVARL